MRGILRVKFRTKDLFDSGNMSMGVRTLTVEFTACPSCKRQNRSTGRYCIHCGFVLKPVYCSLCGAVNPDRLPQCLQCGGILPDLTEIKWHPTVTAAQPRSPMILDKPNESGYGVRSKLKDQVGKGRFILRSRKKRARKKTTLSTNA